MKFNSLIPELSVSSLEDSVEFYVKYLLFKIEYERPEDGFVFLSFGQRGPQIMLEQINGNWETGPLERPFGRGVNFQMEVDAIDPLVARLRSASVKLFREPYSVSRTVGALAFHYREFLVQDPDGYLLRFSERGALPRK